MNCPRCGFSCREDDICCPICGNKGESPTLFLPAPKKRNHWIPVGMLAVLFLLGTILFFLIPMDTSSTANADYLSVVDGALYFDQSHYSEGPVLNVPETVDGQTVTAIADSCFENVTGITTITLPDTICTIGDRAFTNCSDLRGLFVPEGVGTIGTEAFCGCDALEAVYLPMTLNAIGDGAFEGCPSMRYVFYAGFYEALYNMYPAIITPFTYAICLDGTYAYGAQ